MKIYCIEDINDLKYVGSTEIKLTTRLSKHKTDKRLGRNTSSKKLHLEHSIIYLLEECDEDVFWDRETYWMEKLNSVNQRRGLTKDRKKYHKQYYIDNRDKILNYSKQRQFNLSQAT